jgi:hypothetical protein
MPKAIGPHVVSRYREDALTFGIAGIIGLIPGIGDIFDALVSLYIIVRAIQLGTPRITVARMFVNVGIESLAGSVPVLGDLFDIGFKANRRNYRLLKTHISQPERHRTKDWLFLIVTVVLTPASIALPVIALFEIAKHVLPFQ